METYKIVRMFFAADKDTEVIETGLTLDEAQEWCNRPDTRGGSTEDGTAWFDGYEAE